MSAIATFWLSCCCSSGRRRRRQAEPGPLSRRRSNPFCRLRALHFEFRINVLTVLPHIFQFWYNFIVTLHTHTHREGPTHTANSISATAGNKIPTINIILACVCLWYGEATNSSSSVSQNPQLRTHSHSFSLPPDQDKGLSPGWQMWLEFREQCPRTSKSRHYSNWNKRQLIGTTWELRT